MRILSPFSISACRDGEAHETVGIEQPLLWRKPFDRIPWYLIALLTYYLPWISHPAAGLTFNAYDLAEWVSLHPEVRGASLPLVAPLLLRAVLAGLALLFGLRAFQAAAQWARLVYAGLALPLALTLMPPFDFFRGAWDDPNYRQQFALSVGTLIGLGALIVAYWRGTANHRLRRIENVVSVLVIISAIAGELMALTVIRSLNLDVLVGVGVIGLAICLGLAVVAARHGAKLLP